MSGRHAEAGFSLIELVLVILVLGLALLPLLTQMVQTNVSSVDGQAASTAAFLSRERIEQVLADRNAPAIGFAAITNGRYPAESPVNGFPGFTRATSVSADSSYGGLTFRAVTVTVSSARIPPVALTTWVIQ